MADFGLDDELSIREQASEFGGRDRGKDPVEVAGEQQHRRVHLSQSGAGGRRVEGPAGVEDPGGPVITLGGLCRLVRLCRGIPPAVGHRGHGDPVCSPRPASDDRLEPGCGGRVPGLVLAQRHDLPAGAGRNLDADGPSARRDQRECADPVWILGRVADREAAAGRMREQLHPVQTEVLAQRLHIADLTITAIGGGVGRMPGLAGAAQVQQDQLPVRGKTTEVAEVGAGSHRPARQADQRSGGIRTGADDVIGDFGPIRCGKGRHGPILSPAGVVGQPVK
jgi:hypothetical protein